MIKNLLTILFLAVFSQSATAQLFTDDFESYDVDSYVGNNATEWTTWSGATGGAEDAQVVNDKAKSGSNSIYFMSTGQGPQDVVLDFGQKYTSGTFTLGFSIFVTDQTSAYWNFQQETTIGTTWAGNAYYRNDGMLAADAGGATMTTPFNADEWNDVVYEIDLDNNEWVIKLNGVCVGTMLAPAAVASLDIFPLTQNTTSSEFWIDDVMFDHDPTVQEKAKDLTFTNGLASGAAFVGSPTAITVEAHNTGSEAIQDIEVVLTSGGVEVAKNTFDGLNLAAGEFTVLGFENALDPVQGVNEITISLASIDGFGADDAACNNTSVLAIPGIEKAPGRRVIVEELTGTWCGWCPRGHVFMEAMAEKYGDDFVGVAVHGGDVMEVEEYTEYVEAFPGVSGYPSAIVDRDAEMDPSQIETAIVQRLQEPAEAALDIKSTYDEDLNELVATITVTALSNLSSTRRIGLIITEDEVTGTSAAYNQTNYYAGGTSGAMGGYEDLPDPVPASDMVYEQVARAIAPSATGMSIEESLPAGESRTFTIGVTLSEDVNVDHINLVAFLSKPNPVREIMNSYSLTFAEAQANTVDNEEVEIDVEFEINPNPASNTAVVNVELTKASDVSLEVYSITGQLLRTRNYGKLAGSQSFNLDVAQLQNGIYNVMVVVDGNRTAQRIVVAN